jgi:hypothetical protein
VVSPSHTPPATEGWCVGIAYLKRGLVLSRREPGLYLSITLVYALPALLSAWLVSHDGRAAMWQQAAAVGLSWITIVLGTVVIMIAVGCHAHRQSTGLGQATVYALSWLPRYLWTNVHTSVVFWGAIGLLLLLRGWQQQMLPVAGAAAELGLNSLWGLVLGATALYLHARTLLAPFLAVHADLPATLAALEAWRLSGRALVPCLSTLIVAGVPLLLMLLLGVGVLLAPPAELRPAVGSALPELLSAAIQIVRPVLIPATYWLYTDLWEAERARRRWQGAPPEPATVRAVLELTRRLPKLGRWPVGEVRGR